MTPTSINNLHADASDKVKEISQSNIIANGLDKLSGPAINNFDHLRITECTEIDPPVAIVTINDEIISTECNVSTISGAGKSGKSAFTGILIAGAISPTGVIDGLDGLRVQPNKSGKAVIHIDTEQARHKHQYNIRSILKRCDLEKCPEYFLSYNIREMDIDQYSEVTTSICEAAQKEFGSIHLIVIDGIADYISDVNDPIQSNAIVKYFEDLAIKYRTPVIVIVHTNPGSDKERGHLGSQCQRKSESVLMVKTENDISFIEPKFLRMAGKGNIPPLQFMYDKDKGYHVGCGIRTADQTIKDNERLDNIRSCCMKVFGGQVAYSYNEALEAIMRETQKQNRTVKEVFKEMKAHQMIVKGSDNNWRLNLNDQ